MIIAAGAKLMEIHGYSKNARRLSIEPEFMKGLVDFIRNKFTGANIEEANGVIHIEGQANKNISYELSVFVTMTVDRLINVSISGSTHGNVLVGATMYQPVSGDSHKGEIVSLPFQASKDIFPEDDPAMVADWVYREVNSKIKHTQIEFLKKQQRIGQ